MAHITEKRLREMEEEMNRFEEEISGPVPQHHGPRIIRASGYSNMRPVTPLPPPPAPPSLSRPPSMRPESSMPALPLPPAPPAFPGGRGFMPPQLRHRPPGSTTNTGPPTAAPPAPPRPAAPAASPAPAPSSTPFVGPQMPPHLAAQGGFMPPPMNMGMPGPFPMPAPFPGTMPGQMPFRPHIPPFVPTPTPSAPARPAVPAAPAVVEQPKVVYMAAPVRNNPSASAAGINNATSKKAPAESIKVAPGIELNVPTRDIEAERAHATQMMSQPMDVAGSSADADKKDKKEKKQKKYIRTAAGQTWEDATLADWDPDDFRMFCGDLGNEVTDEILTRAFSKYPSFVKAKVVRDKRSKKTKGFGFASFRDPNDFVRCMREMNGKYVGNRPIKLRKSNWRDRQVEVVRKKEKEKKKLGLK